MKISALKQKTEKNAIFGGVGIFSASLLLAVSAAYIFNPTVGTHAAESAEADINLTVGSAIGITIDTNDLNLQTNPGSFVHDAINVSVTTNSQYGYTLTLEDNDDESSLVHTNNAVSNKLTSTFTGAKTSSGMTDNTWGFSLDETSYYFIPTVGKPVALKRTNSALSGYDITTVDFGAKVGATLTAGTYTDTVKFTAYVNGADGEPEENAEIRELGEVNVNPCKSVRGVSGGILTDSRDGNTYAVKGLKDGRCWMTENLRIANITLTSANSNVAADFTIPASSTDGFSESDTDINANHAYVDPTYGGYYTYYTATAGTGGSSLTSGDASSDICPKGWKLPSKTEFETLYNNYHSGKLMRGEPGFVDSGMIYNGALSGAGSFGYYWSLTTHEADYAYRLWITKSAAYPSESMYKYGGYAVRCVAVK